MLARRAANRIRAQRSIAPEPPAIKPRLRIAAEQPRCGSAAAWTGRRAPTASRTPRPRPPRWPRAPGGAAGQPRSGTCHPGRGAQEGPCSRRRGKQTPRGTKAKATGSGGLRGDGEGTWAQPAPGAKGSPLPPVLAAGCGSCAGITGDIHPPRAELPEPLGSWIRPFRAAARPRSPGHSEASLRCPRRAEPPSPRPLLRTGREAEVHEWLLLPHQDLPRPQLRSCPPPWRGMVALARLWVGWGNRGSPHADVLTARWRRAPLRVGPVWQDSLAGTTGQELRPEEPPRGLGTNAPSAAGWGIYGARVRREGVGDLTAHTPSWAGHRPISSPRGPGWAGMDPLRCLIGFCGHVTTLKIIIIKLQNATHKLALESDSRDKWDPHGR